MNVFMREFRMALPSFLTWAIVLLAVGVMFLSLFPAFSHDITTSKQLLENFPPQLRSILGLSLETFFTFLGFYAYVLSYIALAGSVQAMNLGLTMTNREAVRSTTDFLLTKPVGRLRIFAAKLASSLFIILLTNGILSGGVYIAAKIFKVGTFDGATYILLAGSFLLLQLIFLSLGIVVSQLVGRIRSVITVSLSTCFGFFALSLLVGLTGDKALRYLTPFQYFDHLSIVATKTYEMPFLWLAVAIIILSIIVSALLYKMRDARSLA